MRTTLFTFASKHARSRFANHLVFVSGRNLSGRGAKRTPAKWTTTSTFATAWTSVSDLARSAPTRVTFSAPWRSGGRSVRWTIRRMGCHDASKCRANVLPRFPAAPVIKMVDRPPDGVTGSLPPIAWSLFGSVWRADVHPQRAIHPTARIEIATGHPLKRMRSQAAFFKRDPDLARLNAKQGCSGKPRGVSFRRGHSDINGAIPPQFTNAPILRRRLIECDARTRPRNQRRIPCSPPCLLP